MSEGNIHRARLPSCRPDDHQLEGFVNRQRSRQELLADGSLALVAGGTGEGDYFSNASSSSKQQLVLENNVKSNPLGHSDVKYAWIGANWRPQ